MLPAEHVERRRWMTCLEERRKTLQSMSDLFATADLGVVENAINTVMLEVQPVESCLSEDEVLPAPQHATASDEAMRSALARARVLRAAGKYAEAEQIAGEVRNDAEDAEARLLFAEALVLIGEISAELRRSDAEQLLRFALAASERVANDELRARAWIALIAWYAHWGKQPEARFADSQANAILGHMGRPMVLESTRLMHLAQLESTDHGDLDKAVRYAEAAVRLRRQLRPRRPADLCGRGRRG